MKCSGHCAESIRRLTQLSARSQVFEHYVGRALLPVSPRVTGKSARPTFFDSARKLVSWCLLLRPIATLRGSQECSTQPRLLRRLSWHSHRPDPPGTAGSPGKRVPPTWNAPDSASPLTGGRAISCTVVKWQPPRIKTPSHGLLAHRTAFLSTGRRVARAVSYRLAQASCCAGTR